MTGKKAPGQASKEGRSEGMLHVSTQSTLNVKYTGEA